MWDGNVPVHEWVEVDPAVEDPAAQQEAVAWDVGLFDRKHLLSKRSAQGPPPPEEAGTSNAPITWVFEPESFAPLAKLTATERFGIVTDHLGTPAAMLDEQGGTAWSAAINVYGELRNVVGEKAACPFRWPGQYEDEETGLYYNRFRYYDPDAGAYASQDPIGLVGSLRPHGYVHNPLMLVDSLGLSSGPPCGTIATAGTDIATPYGPAVQGSSPAALAARGKVSSGATLWRIGTLGKSQAGEAQFWALEHPSTPGFAARYGIPPANVAKADFIESATLKPGTSFVTRIAPPVGTNPGGGVEVVVPSGGVSLGGFSTM
jgi:RHS repeat-associated protein